MSVQREGTSRKLPRTLRGPADLPSLRLRVLVTRPPHRDRARGGARPAGAALPLRPNRGEALRPMWPRPPARPRRAGGEAPGQSRTGRRQALARHRSRRRADHELERKLLGVLLAELPARACQHLAGAARRRGGRSRRAAGVRSSGRRSAAMSMSSKPTTDSSSGTLMPRIRAASSTPSAWMSEAAKTAVGRSGSRNRSIAVDRATWWLFVPSRTYSEPQLDTGARERALVAAGAVEAGGEAEGIGRLVADEGDAPVAELDQVRRRQLAAVDVVDDDRSGTPECGASTSTTRQPRRRAGARPRRRAGSSETMSSPSERSPRSKSWNACSRRSSDSMSNSMRSYGRARERTAATPRTRSTADGLVKKGTTTPITCVRRKREVARERARPVVEGVDRLEHPAPGSSGRTFACAVQDARDGRDAHPRPGGHVGDRGMGRR